MIDSKDLKWRCSSCFVYFRNLPDDNFHGAIYIENEYHKKFNQYLSRWGWWLQKFTFNKYECGFTDLTYIPKLSKKIKKHLFSKESKDNGISVFEYYPLVGLDNKALSYKTQIIEILKKHKENAQNYRYSADQRGIGHAGLYSSGYEKNENYADNMFESLDQQTRTKLHLFKKQVIELERLGVPLSLLENIIHQNDKLSKLVITKKHEILLPDYNNMVIKMEPLVKAVFFLFLKHPEGIVFKYLPDYREELIYIYRDLRPLGLDDRSLHSIEDVTNPCLNSINEKCARIRAAFINKFDEHLAKNYFITGERGEAKKITLDRELVIWEK